MTASQDLGGTKILESEFRDELSNTEASHSYNYVEWILARLGAEPERTVCQNPDGKQVTCREFTELVHRTARVLAGLGIARDSTVTLLSNNRVEALTTRYAANLLGARIVSLYAGQSAAVQARIVADVDTDVLVVDNALTPMDTALRRDRTMLTIGPARDGDDLLALAAGADAEPVPACPVSSDHIFCIRHRGGTTGHPKGILQSSDTYTHLLESLSAGSPRAGSADVLLVCMTLARSSGALADATLLTGGSLVLHAGFDAGRVLADIEKYGVTQLWLMPPLLYQLADHPAALSADTTTLRHITYGGAAVAPAKIRRALEVFGPILVQYYGQSEFGDLITSLSAEDHLRPELLASVGRPVPGVELRIVDELGHEVAPGMLGEVCLRVPSESSGYVNNPELTAQVWRDGWLHTGDVGRIDDDGYLYLTDRIKDMILVMSGHVYPTEVEEMLLQHPDVAEAAVYGVRDIDSLERVHAAVVPEKGHFIDIGDVVKYVEEIMARQYVPRHTQVMRAIPLTDVGRPDKKALRSSAGALAS